MRTVGKAGDENETDGLGLEWARSLWLSANVSRLGVWQGDYFPLYFMERFGQNGCRA